MKTYVLIAIAVCSLTFQALSQINFAEYANRSSPFFDLMEYQDVYFQWNMAGNIQLQLNEGINSLKEEKLSEARAHLDEAQRLDSTLWVVFYYRGVVHKRLGSIENAAKDFATCIKLNPNVGEAYYEFGKLYHHANLIESAVKCYKQAIKVRPTLVQAYYNLGNIELIKGNFREALKIYKQCNEVNPKFPNAYMAQGLLKYKESKKYNEAIVLFNQALKADSSFSEPYFWRGINYLNLNQPARCIADWDLFLQFNPHNTFVMMMRGYLYIEMENYDKAFVDLRKAILANEVGTDRYQSTQTMLNKRVDFQAMARYLMRTGYGLDEEAFKHVKAAFCLALVERYSVALTNAIKAEKIQPTATVYYLKGHLYEQLNKHDSAFNNYSAALKLDNNIFDAHKKRGIYWSRKRNWKAAYEDFDEMLRLQPETYATYRLRGMTRSFETDYNGAIKDLLKYVAIDSMDYDAMRRIVECRNAMGDSLQATDDMRRMINIQPTNWQLYRDVASNYLHFKDTAKAIEVYRAYASRDESSSHPIVELAKIYVGQKDWDAARQQIEKIKMWLSKNVTYYGTEFVLSDQLCLEGMIKYHHADYASAIEKFNESLKLAENNFEARYFRAQSFEKTGEIKKAISDFTFLIKVPIAPYKDSKNLLANLQRR